MFRPIQFCSSVTLVVAMLLTAGLKAETGNDSVESFKPRWKVGQSWVVQTVLRQSQARRVVDDTRADRPVPWRFVVAAMERRRGDECYRVEVTCLQPGTQPSTTLWVDRESMTLRGVQTRIRTAGGWRTIAESYRSSSGQAFPAFGPHSVPPLELPVFLEGAKGRTTFQYQAASTQDGAKAVGEIGFAFTVEQTVQASDEKDLPAHLPERFAKSLRKKPTVQVTLKSATGRVRQWWQAGTPWPVFSDNGIVECSLVSTDSASASPP